jgi:hypothetical protein
VIALVALAALCSGVLAIATQPQTTPLRREVMWVKRTIATDHQQILALQSSLTHAASHSARLQVAVGSLRHHMDELHGVAASLQQLMGAVQAAIGSLHYRVGTLQGNFRRLRASEDQLHAQSRSLFAGVRRLQQQLHGLKVEMTKGHGGVKASVLPSAADRVR